MFRKILFVLVLSVFGSIALKAQVNPLNIDIVRDKWGVPHIFGKTDAETAYGLAWATAEDDFKTMQELLLAIRCRLGEVNGKSGAILDFLSFISGADKVVEAAYDTAFSPAYRKVLDAYVAGVNAYATAHKEEVVRKGLFPITGKDLIKGYVLTNTLLTGVYLDVQKIFQNTIKQYEVALPNGSNGWAFNRGRTADGKVYLGVNSHQPLEGLFSWYEAHICSDEGLNMLGGTFAGGANIFHGANPSLGWACTLNHPDMSDVYKLEMNPKNHLQYKMDGKWETLEVRKKTIRVKVGPIRLPINKTFYWSKYGTTLKNKDGYYAIRFPANMEIRTGEQLYWMNKAKNYTDWHKAMAMNAIPGLNVVYADRQDTIFYVSTAELPYRDAKYQWLNVLKGNTYGNLWAAKFHPFDSLPQVLNPHSGYLINTNNSAFDVTCKGENCDASRMDPTYGFGLETNNRSIMAHYLIGKYPRLSYQDFKTIKFNRDFNDSLYTYSLANMDMMRHLDPAKYPDIADAIAVAKRWDLHTNIEDTDAALVAYAVYELIDKISNAGRQYEYNTFTEAEYVHALRSAKKHMLKYFGSINVPLGRIQKHARGNVELPIGGGPDVIAATISQPYKKGMRRTFVGDSYILLAQYSKDSVQLESINAYGASNRPNSPHYTDQMQMYVDQKMKPMTLDKATIYKTAEKIYHPLMTAKDKEELRVSK